MIPGAGWMTVHQAAGETGSRQRVLRTAGSTLVAPHAGDRPDGLGLCQQGDGQSPP